MGLRFRKSINLGGGARLNISKKGIGYSFGTKGARITKKAGGGTRSTLSMPGTGISYVKETSGKKSSNSQPQKNYVNAGTGGPQNQPRRKTWLWVLGWLVIFPLPLTILLLRDKEKRTIPRYILAAGAWLVYLILMIASRSNSGNTETTATRQQEVRTVESESSETIESSKEEQKTTETPAPAVAESINIALEKNSLILGEKLTIKADIFPENAEDKTIIWSSSDTTVASVDNNGIVTPVGDGQATITAETSNGKSASTEISVDGSKRWMRCEVTNERTDDNNIGDQWSFINEINGERVVNEYIVSVGDTLSFHAKYQEEDDNPDIGESSTEYTVTEEAFQTGFWVSMQLAVTENGGRNSGQSAIYDIKYTFFVE